MKDEQRLLLQHLPAIYHGDPAFVSFLDAFEALLIGTRDSGGIRAKIQRLPQFVDADLAPAEFLPWLASWVGLALHPDLDESKRRALIRRAIPLFQRRGTKRGLEELLALVTDAQVEVLEPQATPFRVGSAVIGRSTYIGNERPHYFEVNVRLTSRVGLTVQQRLERLVRHFIEQAKPAHTRYVLRIVDASVTKLPATAKSGEGSDHGKDQAA